MKPTEGAIAPSAPVWFTISRISMLVNGIFPEELMFSDRSSFRPNVASSAVNKLNIAQQLPEEKIVNLYTHVKVMVSECDGLFSSKSAPF